MQFRCPSTLVPVALALVMLSCRLGESLDGFTNGGNEDGVADTGRIPPVEAGGLADGPADVTDSKWPELDVGDGSTPLTCPDGFQPDESKSECEPVCSSGWIAGGSIEQGEAFCVSPMRIGTCCDATTDCASWDAEVLTWTPGGTAQPEAGDSYPGLFLASLDGSCYFQCWKSESDYGYGRGTQCSSCDAPCTVDLTCEEVDLTAEICGCGVPYWCRKDVAVE